MKYYVYIVCCGDGIYVGKGMRDRYRQSLKRLNGLSVKIIARFSESREAVAFEEYVWREYVFANVTTFNKCSPHNGGHDGKQHTEETKQFLREREYTQEWRDKISRTSTGRIPSQETRDLISEKLTGVPKPEGFGENLSKALTGVPKSSEERIAVSEGMKNYWANLTEEEYQQVCESRKGQKRTPETGQNISKALQGHEVTQETRDKISVKLKGKPMSEAHKEAIRQAHLKKRKA